MMKNEHPLCLTWIHQHTPPTEPITDGVKPNHQLMMLPEIPYHENVASILQNGVESSA